MVEKIFHVIELMCAENPGNVNRDAMTLDDWRIARLTPLGIVALGDMPIVHSYRMLSVNQARDVMGGLNQHLTIDAERDNIDGLFLVCYSNYQL